MHRCLSCGKEIEVDDAINYCNFACLIDQATREGGKVIAPNGLPINCVQADGTMLEHEHADHPTYKFPIEIEFTGQKTELPEWDSSYSNESHALIYTDGYVALTLYEHCYSIWSLMNGECLGGHLYPEKGWKLTDQSLNKIKS